MNETYRERHGDEPRDDASARHCEIRIDHLPGQLLPGRYAVSFIDMEYPVGATRPVLRFRYQGRLADVAYTPDEVAAEEQRLDDAYEQHPEPERTGSPRSVEQDLYGEPPLISRELIEAAVPDPARNAAQFPDLYQVSTVETLNVSKLARVVSALLRKGVLEASDLGEDYGAAGSWPGIERWLRG